MIPLIDAHIHLQDSAFDSDRQACIDHAEQLGVTRFVSNGTSPDDWDKVAELANTDSRIVPCFGLHPWYVTQHAHSDWLGQLESHLNQLPSGVGEIGLDRWIKDFDIDAQMQAFRAQLSLARELNRPAMIHCLRAWGLLLDTLQTFGPFPAGLVIHGYGGAAHMIEPLSQLNTWFSFAGSILDPQKTRARQALLTVPLDRLLIETDAPDMPPPEAYRIEPHHMQANGKYRNEPANLPNILKGIAELRGLTPEALSESISHNAQQCFGELL